MKKKPYLKGISAFMLVGLLILTACQPDGGGEPSPFKGDLSELEIKIAEAKAESIGVAVSTNGSDVASGMKWVTQEVMTTFEAEIALAIAVYELPTSQQQVDDAVTDLTTAIITFKDAQQNGTKTSGFNATELATLIATAEAAKYGVQTSTDGNDISPTEYWVTQIALNALNNAITTVKTTLSDANYLALVSAIETFKTAKQFGKKASSITINGLAEFNGSTIQLGLFASQEIDLSSQPAIYGEGEIQNDTVTIALYHSSNNPWVGSGSWYVGFKIGNNLNTKFYISNSMINFASNPNPIKNLSDFKPYVLDSFEYTFSEIAEMFYITIPSEGVTLNQLFKRGTYYTMNYDDAVEIGYPQFYKDRALTQPFTGSEKIYANTKFYSESPMDYFKPEYVKPQIGVISGTITLIDIPSSVSQVYIEVAGTSDNDWDGETIKITTSGSSTLTNVNWSTPIHGDNAFSSSTAEFMISFNDWTSGFQIPISGTKTINGINASGINLGTVSLKTVTLSGNITVTYQGQTVPIVQIRAEARETNYWACYSYKTLTSPNSNASWTMQFPSLSSSTDVYFYVAGYSDDYEFLGHGEVAVPKQVYNSNVSGITINLGNITKP